MRKITITTGGIQNCSVKYMDTINYRCRKIQVLLCACKLHGKQAKFLEGVEQVRLNLYFITVKPIIYCRWFGQPPAL